MFLTSFKLLSVFICGQKYFLWLKIQTPLLLVTRKNSEEDLDRLEKQL